MARTKEKEKDKDCFSALRQQIADKSKGTHISLLSKSDIASIREWIKTPALDLNRILSGSLYKGLPSKILSLLVGPEASFKSSFMALCGAEAQKQGYHVFVIDTEGAWTSDFVQRWGIDPENVTYVYQPFIEEIMVILGQIIDNEDVAKLCIIVDSLGGIESKKLVDDAVGGDVKADQGTLQKKIKRMLKMMLNICKGKNSIGMMSGHFYGNPSGYGDPEQVGGGKFAKLAPDIIISLKKSKMLDKEKNVIGTNITAITLKNRFYPPFNEAKIEIDYKNGINSIAGMVDLAMEAGFIERGGAWYTNTLTGEKFQGEKGVLESINEEMLNKIDNWLKDSCYSTVNKEIAEAASILEKENEGDDENGGA